MKIKTTNNRFKVARINAGYSQRDVSRILDFLSFQALSLYEQGKRIPSNMVLYSLPKLYHVSLDYLLNEDFTISELGLNEKSISILKSNLEHTSINTILKKFIQNSMTRSEE
ncbi:helix-turn-helix transcriptional regulator [Allocoprobacillus halotolerans]|uniref:Helix-turn-helix transcriptional regulator n=1 Tax=Allocoprobacillus halotolerans TaxID=2944914 RepID=A0ABY5HZN2_9FIRM|nr:helix-turn-helix transcriptional regulator [Allocoprobacillus halotolerans]UTY38547.1 helix-turn-helix transcriptional regulator [Allocoprobacillus halotolerans]